MKILIEGSKVLRYGFINYIPTDGQEVHEIEPSELTSLGKYRLKWVNGKLEAKTQAELDHERDLKIAYDNLMETDKYLTRPVEDIYDVLSATQKSNLSTATKDKIADKKAKRQAYLSLL